MPLDYHVPGSAFRRKNNPQQVHHFEVEVVLHHPPTNLPHREVCVIVRHFSTAYGWDHGGKWPTA
jgi:hypothetical protein